MLLAAPALAQEDVARGAPTFREGDTITFDRDLPADAKKPNGKWYEGWESVPEPRDNRANSDITDIGRLTKGR